MYNLFGVIQTFINCHVERLLSLYYITIFHVISPIINRLKLQLTGIASYNAFNYQMKFGKFRFDLIYQN